MSSYLDLLPSNERERIRKRLRSPEAYERLREKVKGPEDLEQELERGERLAEAHFALESDPQAKEALKQSLIERIQEKGAEAVVDGELPPELRQALEQGTFDVAIDAHPESRSDALILLPEGNVHEKIPLQQAISDQCLHQLTGGGSR